MSEPVKVRLGRHCQMVLPVQVRRRLNVGEGDELLVWVREGHIVMVPRGRRPARELRGLYKEAWAGEDPEDYVARERGSWEE